MGDDVFPSLELRPDASPANNIMESGLLVWYSLEMVYKRRTFEVSSFAVFNLAKRESRLSEYCADENENTKSSKTKNRCFMAGNVFGSTIVLNICHLLNVFTILLADIVILYFEITNFDDALTLLSNKVAV